MNLEKLLFKKISVWILLLTIILSLIFAIWFGYLTTQSRTVLKIAKTPDVIKKIFTDFSNLAVHEKRFNNKRGLYVYLPPSENKYLLLSRYDGDLERSIVELIDLRQKKKIHEWKPDINKINSYSKLPEKSVYLKSDHNAKRYAIGHPFLLNNGDLLIKSMENSFNKN